MNRKTVIYLSGATVLLVILFLLPVKIPYTVYGTGKVFAINEWVLGRTADGRITSTIQNNQLGIITSYGGKEYQKKDIYNFQLAAELGRKRFVKKGEKVGFLESNELKREIITLQGELDVEKALLQVSLTGAKQQAVKEAEAALQLAQEKLDIQKKLFERTQKMYNDSLIAPQEYDIAFNNYHLAKIEVDLASAKMKTISTGEKPEQIAFVKKRIILLQNQIENLQERLNGLTIKAPFSGMLQHKKNVISTVEPIIPVDPLVNVLDTSQYIIITPIRTKELKYVKTGQKAELELFSTGCTLEATITHIDNGAQIIGGKQAAFVTAVVDNKCPGALPGILAQTVIHTDDLTPFEYLKRVTIGLFYR